MVARVTCARSVHVSSGSSTISAAPADSTFLSVVPDGAVGTVTISNTAAAAPDTTQQAVGKTQQQVGPLTCSPSVTLGGACDPNAGVCTAICTIDTTEPYCDASTPCNEELGYTCYKSRCRPPTGAVRVQNKDTCDQGSGNTRFCIPTKGICVGGTCLPCTQHS
ncbi:hypothetical protein Rhopal_000784-T1 [Rhodotorula paludigena]|uniref:Uncharacterized protein n=1 Tax=Rhodotorula paludigena TaxID=86838 RepID=A0AAV5GEQ2_9BASI|nr:hypothetical protein Rhopal_000784-T1 [Rhodotorula paludigena]